MTCKTPSPVEYENTMLAVDTNVVVRVVTNDDPEQSPRAIALFEQHSIFLSKTVLLETEWVLRFAYQIPRETIVSTLRKLIGLRQVEVEHIGVVVTALDWHEQGMDFADALHLAGSAQAMRFATFDEKLAKRARRLQTKEILVV